MTEIATNVIITVTLKYSVGLGEMLELDLHATEKRFLGHSLCLGLVLIILSILSLFHTI